MNNSLAEVHPELVSEWSEKNLTLTPDDITFGSNKKVYTVNTMQEKSLSTDGGFSFSGSIQEVIKFCE